MATFTATRAASTFPVHQGGNGQLQVAYGTIEVAANPTDGDIYEMCKLPAGSTVVGGYLYADSLDSGTEALDLDLGWAANGSEAADPDGFGNFGTFNEDAVTNIKPETGNYRPLGGVMLAGDYQAFTAETTVQVECNTTASAGFAAGALSVTLFYVTNV